jgi:type IV secretory pathway TraG/TraD family ATPase VirD4
MAVLRSNPCQTLIGDTTITTETINRRSSGLAEEITSSQGEARRRLMTPDELRTMPIDTMLMLEATAAPLILKTKLYFEDNELAERANIPYQVTRIRPEPERPMPSYAQGLPAVPASKRQQAPPIVVDGDIEEEDDDQDSQYILQE